jgi:hypothetical protein
MAAMEEESLTDCARSSNQPVIEEALEDLSIDCGHKKVFDRTKEGMVVISVDYESK